MGKLRGGGEMDKPDSTEKMIVLIRYLILITMIGISFIYIHNVNVQYIIFITLLALVIFGTIFLINDLTNTTGLIEKIGVPDAIISITTNSSTFLKMFLGSVGVGIMFKILSLTFFLVVFTYGRKQLNASNSRSKKLSSHNQSILNRYILFFIISSVLIAFVLSIIFITHTSPETQIVIRNILLILLSLGIVSFTTVELYYSYIFLKIRQSNGTLYEITT